ncbi:low molecular weight protein-tyrosine-phosphatase (plasmid) [Pseudoalteromonas sp. T1lg65]|uniref:low molecular weight protein-tyrosine-phosphatase n=1 Tax=Pseudoalteromonas sp. T1lg65 TaxID=2077101 RepID=UPI003F7A1977
MKQSKITKILVVCMGNICRSPTMEAVLKYKAHQKGMFVDIDSAGTIAYHQGNPPDPRSIAAGRNRGYDFSGVKARKVTSNDFAAFDLILCADNANLADLKSWCPPEYQHKLHLFLEYGHCHGSEVPDPYYGGEKGFELVLDLVERASDNILQQINLSKG